MVDEGITRRSGAVSRADKVYEQLLSDISEGRWGADEVVSAYGISRRLGISRTPVVEALKRLETEGLVEIEPKVGARLTRSSPEAREELFSIVTSLVGLAAERAAGRVDEQWIERADELLDALAAAAKRNDAAEVRRFTREIHRRVIRASLPAHAIVVERLWQLLGVESQRYVAAAVRPTIVSELQAIVDALRAGSPFRARAAAEQHVAAGMSSPRVLSSRAGLEHSALLYGSRAELIGSAVPFVLAGLQRGEPVLVVSRQENLEAIGCALGTDRTKLDYQDSTHWYDDPAATLRRYREYIEERGLGSRVRIIGEPPWSDRSATAVEDWLRYESVINVALETSECSLVCPYDVDQLPDRIVRGAQAAHPHLRETGELSPSAAYREFFATAHP